MAWAMLGMGNRSPSMACGYPICPDSRRDKGSALPAVMMPADVNSTPPGSPCRLGDFKVVIGTSQMMDKDNILVRRIVNFSGKCEREVRTRLSYGDVGSERANRVMHVALINDVPVGWCSSSTSSWGGDGHWGALAVDPAAQGKGVASALVAAAEKRLLDAGCQSVQMEYRFTIGDKTKERLYNWYEGKLGFDGGPRHSGFRVCHKLLSAEAYQAQHFKSFSMRQSRTMSEASTVSTGQWQEQTPKRARASSTSSSSSSSRSGSKQPQITDSP